MSAMPGGLYVMRGRSCGVPGKQHLPADKSVRITPEPAVEKGRGEFLELSGENCVREPLRGADWPLEEAALSPPTIMLTKRSFLTALPAATAVILGGCDKKTEGGAPSGPSAPKKKKIAYVTNGVASFWTIAEAGVKAGAEKFGVDAETLMPVGGVSDQKRMIEDLLTRGVDGIAVSPIDSANQTELLNEAARRTKLITHDSDAPKSNRLLYIGMDNYKAGRLCGDLVLEAMPSGGSVMIFVGRMGQDNARGRRQGLIDAILGRPENPANFDPPGQVLEGNGFKILGTLTDEFDRAKGKANAEDTLAKHPDIQCMVGLFAYNPPLMLKALEQAGKLGQVKVIAFDEEDATLEGIQKGTVHGTVVQNPYMYGYKSVEILADLLKGNTSVIPATKFIDIPARQIRKDNVDEFWADLKAKTSPAK